MPLQALQIREREVTLWKLRVRGNRGFGFDDAAIGECGAASVREKQVSDGKFGARAREAGIQRDRSSKQRHRFAVLIRNRVE